MTDPITVLGLTKKTSDIIKDALDFARETKNTDLAQKLIDLYRDFVDLADANQELKNEIQRLQSQIRLKGAMVFKAPFYYQEGDSTPFCPKCYETGDRAVHLVSWDAGRGDHWFCTVCQQSLFRRQAAV